MCICCILSFLLLQLILQENEGKYKYNHEFTALQKNVCETTLRNYYCLADTLSPLLSNSAFPPTH